MTYLQCLELDLKDEIARAVTAKIEGLGQPMVAFHLEEVAKIREDIAKEKA